MRKLFMSHPITPKQPIESSLHQKPSQLELPETTVAQDSFVRSHEDTLQKIEAHHTESSKELELQEVEDRPLQLTTTPELSHSLNSKWAELLFNNPEQGVIKQGSEDSPANFLSQYGLKNAQAVTTFLLTPAGQSVQEQMAKQMAEKEANIEHIRREQREHELLVHRTKIALLLWYLSKKAHASKKVNELILDQIEKAEQRLHKAAEQPPKSLADAKYRAGLSELIRDYDKAIDQAKHEQKSLDTEGQRLAAEHGLLTARGLKLDKKYSTYNQSLDEIAMSNFGHSNSKIDNAEFDRVHEELTAEMVHLQTEIDDLTAKGKNPSAQIKELDALNLKFARMNDARAIIGQGKFEEVHAELASQIEQLQKEIDTLTETIQDPSQKQQELNDVHLKFAAMQGARSAISDTQFKRMHAQFSQEMDKLQDEIDKLIEQDEDPQDKLQELNALNLKFATMHDAQAVSQGRKYTIETSVDGQSAHFVMDKEDQLMTTNDDGELVAVDPKEASAQDFDSSKLFLQKSGNKLVQDADGKIYLLKPTQSLEEVKKDPRLSENSQRDAKESFSRAKQEIMSVKHVIGHHKGMEKGAHEKHMQTSEDLISVNKADKELVANQIRLLQAVQADARNALRQAPTPTPQAGMGAPQIKMTPPSPMPTVTGGKSLSSSQVPSVKFGQLLKELQLEGQKAQLTRFANTPASRQSLDQEFNQRLKNGAKPLSPYELATLERRLAANGKVNPLTEQFRDKVGATGPNSLLKDDEPSPSRAPRPDPNPFKTTPY